MSSSFLYEKALSLDWNGQVFVLTVRKETPGNKFGYLYSYDGTNWFSIYDISNSPVLSNNNLYNVKWMGSKHAIVGNIATTQGNTILRSNDGLNYSITNTSSNIPVLYDIETNLEYPHTITFPRNTTLALGGISTDPTKISYSLDGGVTWKPSYNSATVFSTKAYNSAWNGKIWVAVGTGTGNTIATSVDGNVWLGRGSYIFYNGAYSVCWAKELNRWVAGGSGGNSLAYSCDGVYWKGLGNSILSTTNDVLWNGNIWVATGSPISGNNSIVYSYDGISWNTPSQTDLFDLCGNKIIWNGSFWTVIGRSSGINNIATSNNGINWKIYNNISSGVIFTNAYTNYKTPVTLFTLGNTAVASTNTENYSPNSFNITPLSTLMNSTTSAIYNGTNYLVGGNAIIKSANGFNDPINTVPSYNNYLNWVNQIPTISGYISSWSSTTWKQIAFGLGIYVAVGNNGSNGVIAYSSNGTSWTSLQVTGATTSLWQSICFGNGIFVAVSNGAVTAYSNDGINWSKGPNITSANWTSVINKNDYFIASSPSQVPVYINKSVFDGSNSFNDSYVTNNITVNIDFTNNSCYPGSNLIFYNLVDFTSQTIGNSSFTYDTDKTIKLNGSYLKLQPYNIRTVCFWMKINSLTLLNFLIDGRPTMPNGWIFYTNGGDPFGTNWTKLYINGISQPLNQSLIFTTSSNYVNITIIADNAYNVALNIASRATNDYCLKCNIAYILCYSTELSASDIYKNYNYFNNKWFNISSTLTAGISNTPFVAYGNGYYLAINSTGNTIYYTSSITNAWTSLSTTLPTSVTWTGLTFGNGIFVLIASSSIYSYYNPNATSAYWYCSLLPSSSNWSSIVYNSNLFVMASSSTDFPAYSNDGVSWSASTNITYSTINSFSPTLPTSISNIQLWLDAKDNNTLILSGSSVTQWKDKSGLGYNATVHNGSATYNSTGFNTLPAVQINSGGFIASSPSGTFNNGITFFVVFQKNGASLGQYAEGIIAKTNNNIPAPIDMYGNTRLTSGNYTIPSVFNITTATGLNLLVSTVNSASWYEYVNGNLSFTSNSTNSFSDTVSNIYVGTRADKAINFLGVVAEVIVYNRILTTNERQNIEGYLAAKWNISSGLPITHPYYQPSSSLTSITMNTSTNTVVGISSAISSYCVPTYTTNSTINGIQNAFKTLITNTPPWGIYTAENYVAGSTTLNEYRGNGRNVTVSGITLGNASGNGSTASIPYLYGTTSSKMDWSAGSIPSTFTICVVERYNGTNNNRIIQSSAGNWILGYWSGYAGMGYFDGWVTNQSSSIPQRNWNVFIGKNSGGTPNNVMANGQGVGTATGGTGGGSYKLTINNGPYGEASDFALSYVFIWDQALSDASMQLISAAIHSYLYAGNSLLSYNSIVNPLQYATFTKYDISNNLNMSIINNFAWNFPDKGTPTIQPITIAVGEGNNTIGWSTDGIFWNGLGKNVFTIRGNRAIWNGTLWVAVGCGNYWVASSYDGYNWVGRDNILMTEAYDVAWNGTIFVAVGYGGSYNMVASQDGIYWYGLQYANGIFNNRASAITWTGNVWLAYGSGGNTTAISNSPDAWFWQPTQKQNLVITDATSGIVSPGVYNITASSSFSAAYTPNYAIDNSMNPTTTTNWLSSANTYNTTTGINNGLSSPTTYYILPNYTSQTISGEWIQLQFNNSIFIKYYQLSWFINGTNNTSIPKEWYLLGTNDGNLNNWILLDYFTFNTSAGSSPPPPNNIYKYPFFVKLQNIYNNNNAYAYYRFVFPSIFAGGTISNTFISELDLFQNSPTSDIISPYIKPIVTKTHVLYQTNITRFSVITGEQTVYQVADLCGNLINNCYINNGYYTNNIIFGAGSNNITSTCFDGQNMVATTLNGKITYLNNNSLNTALNFDISLNGTNIVTNINSNIYSSCYNGQRIILGGYGGNVITYNTMNSVGSSNIWSKSLNANSIFTKVNGLASNPGFGFQYIPNRIYLNPGEQLSVISPKNYNSCLSSKNTISMDLNNTELVQTITMPTATIIIGILGPTGATGSQGKGHGGCFGINGVQGVYGPTGDNVVGPIGITGFKSLTGSTGISGHTGNVGFTGFIGSIGLKGVSGPTGITGATGYIGYIGTTGELQNDGWSLVTNNNNNNIYLNANISIGSPSILNAVNITGNMNAHNITSNNINISSNLSISNCLNIGNITGNNQMNVNGNVFCNSIDISGSSYIKKLKINQLNKPIFNNFICDASSLMIDFRNSNETYYIDIANTNIVTNFTCILTNFSYSNIDKTYKLKLMIDYKNVLSFERNYCIDFIINGIKYNIYFTSGNPIIYSNTTILIEEISIVCLNNSIWRILCKTIKYD
jgi:hypothetical protein